MRNKKFYIKSLIIKNNSRFYKVMGLREVNLCDMKPGMIAIIGNNGSGKSTLLDDFNPLPNYIGEEVYIPNEIGEKLIEFMSLDGEMCYNIRYLFEPNKDSHKCSCYIQRKNYVTGEVVEMNPAGLLTTGERILDEHLGINANLMKLYTLTFRFNGVVDMTPTDRRNFLMKQLIDEDLLKTMLGVSSDVGEKYRFFKKVKEASENTLKRLEDTTVMENRLADHKGSLARMTDEYYTMKAVNDKDLPIIEKGISECEAAIKVMEDRYDILKDDILPVFKDIHDRVESSQSIMVLHSNFKMKIEDKTSTLEKRQSKIVELETQISRDSLLASVTKDGDDETYKKLEFEYGDVFEDRKKLLASTDISKLIHMKQQIDNMVHVHTDGEFDSSFKNRIDEILQGLDVYGGEIYQVEAEVNALVSKKKLQDLEKGKYEFINNMRDVMSNIDSKCNGCPIVDKLFKYDNELAKAQKDSGTIDDHLEILTEQRDTLIRKRSKIRDWYNRMYSSYKEYDELYRLFIDARWDIVDVFTKGRFGDYQYKINDAINEVRGYQELKRLKEINELKRSYEKLQLDTEKSNSELRQSMMDSLKEEVEILKSSLSALKDIFNILDRVIKKHSDSDYILYSYEGNLKNVETLQDTLIKTRYELTQLMERKAYIMGIDQQLVIKEEAIVNLTKVIKDLESKISERERVANTLKTTNNMTANLDTINTVVSKSFIGKILNKIMLDIKARCNDILTASGVPFKIDTVEITDSTFTIAINNDKTSTIAIDVSKLSAGERATVGLAIGLACQDMVNTSYNTVILDEVDTSLDDTTRPKFVDMLFKYIDNSSKQIVCVSHNGYFEAYKERMGMIVLKGKLPPAGVENIIWSYKE